MIVKSKSPFCAITQPFFFVRSQSMNIDLYSLMYTLDILDVLKRFLKKFILFKFILKFFFFLKNI